MSNNGILNDKPAEYPGGYIIFVSDLSSALEKKYNNRENLPYSYKVSFVVHKDGTISKIRVYCEQKEYISTIKEEILRLSPKWSPAVKNGKISNSKVVIPIRIRPQ